mmetsp:Transcript_90021/g.188219  ORF Transcript_90021/g.188219 Transcript_90021/m.188219 type:complete len:133 (+) Transcript_90021:59-457(+)
MTGHAHTKTNSIKHPSSLALPRTEFRGARQPNRIISLSLSLPPLSHTLTHSWDPSSSAFLLACLPACLPLLPPSLCPPSLPVLQSLKIRLALASTNFPTHQRHFCPPNCQDPSSVRIQIEGHSPEPASSSPA